ncbi:MAG TPA: cation:proton antiporter, partial [Candidatus Obscuribacterales bacterium]
MMENFWQYWGRLEYNFNPAISAPILAQLPEPVRDPVAVFLIILAIMLVAPLLFERLKMPGIIGLILAGVVVGPHGFGLLARDRTIELLGTVGLLFLMFLGGLETSLDDLKRNADKAVVFGLATFCLPMIIGTAAMLSVGFSPLASILVASCLASHTLVALPVLSKLGIMRSQPVMATLGATLITNVLALLVLAIVVKADQGRLTASFWLLLIPSFQTRPIPSGAKVRQEQLLAKAEMVAHAAVTPVETIGRVDNSIGMGIVRTAEERNASLIVC